MLNEPEKKSENEPIEVRCYFVRDRNALLVRGQFTPIYTDYYLHLMQHGIKHETEPDALLKDALAAMTLHLSSRPWNEGTAWTINFQEPLLNIFVTGDNRKGNVVGRAFTKGVRKLETSLFASQTTREGQPNRMSTVNIENGSVFGAVETFYEQSEQRQARYFQLGDEDFVMLTAQPDCDLEWFKSLTIDAVKDIDQAETLSLLEKRVYHFECGCSIEKILPIIAGTDSDDLFTDGKMIANCPRCGAGLLITEAMLEAFKKASTITKNKKDEE